ncbi:BON domain-containing protein [Calothrix sp. FACHB-1219]|uniref:BON domain-containing protein n=1 Tax=unclassified Calothrix TaxID=2619626 RepID=UPI0016879ABA|nr:MULTISPECIES: BON domain-containing protein [unclassified Calothrix]MBD2201144.1 BON domain-containing protein [Calothrix sp. FACHB-168]MBD2215578.1 BON domain-containing protein [Calothrix sp. FACHB-1219]
MKKLIPFLVSSILVVGAVGCQDASKNASETPSNTNEATQPAKEASAKTKTNEKTTTETGKTPVKEAAANTKTTAKSPILTKLEEKIPGSKLVVEEKDGVVTVKGTVPTEADIKKIEPLVKEQKGVKTVKVEAQVAAKKAQ